LSDDRWQQIEDIFHRAAELAPAARPVFIKQAYGANESLRQEVESLLAHESEDGSTWARLGTRRRKPSPTTALSESSAKAGWESSIGPSIPSWAATSQSKSYLPFSRTTPTGWHASNAKPKCWLRLPPKERLRRLQKFSHPFV
jgi:hypothetical protein